MKKIWLVIFMLSMKVECSKSYLDRIFDRLVYYYPLDNTFGSFKTSLDTNNLEDLLGSKQQDEIYEPTKEELKDYEKFLDNFIPPPCQQLPSKSSDNNFDDNFTSRTMNTNFECDEYIELLYKEIANFIQCNVSNQLSSKIYMKRLDRIKQIIQLIERKGYSSTNRTLFSNIFNRDCIHLLSRLNLKYKSNIAFTNEVYKQFSEDLDEGIDFDLFFKFKRDENYNHYEHNERPYYLVNEYMKIYEHITKVPEILVLGFVLIEKPTIKSIIILYLLNLMINENKEKISENRIYILFLIIKALSCSFKNKVDFIGALKLQEKFSTEHPIFNFLVWELSFRERLSFQKRIKHLRGQKTCLEQKDLIYFNLVVRIFVFQHLIFLKFYDSEHKHYETLKHFYDMTITPPGCYGCKIIKFLDLVQSQFKDPLNILNVSLNAQKLVLCNCVVYLLN